MTTRTVVNLYGRYLSQFDFRPLKDLEDVTIEDMLEVCEEENKSEK